jgi:hypothetical protein
MHINLQLSYNTFEGMYGFVSAYLHFEWKQNLDPDQMHPKWSGMNGMFGALCNVVKLYAGSKTFEKHWSETQTCHPRIIESFCRNRA